ncbi:MAG: sugar ABC transporter permease [Clostridiales bacterium]|nr:sugar ABC transporter permease [Clostridiales bacterium]
MFFIWPFFYSIGYAFTDKPVGGMFIGLQNFTDLLTNKSYLTSAQNTAFFISVSLPLSIGLALALALLINKAKSGKQWFTLVFLIPLVIPSGSTVFFWQSFFTNQGYLNRIFVSFGAPPVNWLETGAVRAVIILIFLWKSVGYNIVLFISALHSIPEEFYEAASLDGAGAFRKFGHITFPCLTPTFLLVIIMTLINSFKVFKEIYVLTGRYPHNSIYLMQHFMNNMFSALNYQKLTAATCILVLVIGLVTQGLFWAERKVDA